MASWSSGNMAHWGPGSAAPQTVINRSPLVARLAKAHVNTPPCHELKSSLALISITPLRNEKTKTKQKKTKTNKHKKVTKQQLSKQSMFCTAVLVFLLFRELWDKRSPPEKIWLCPLHCKHFNCENPVRHAIAVSPSEQLWMLPNDAKGKERSERCIYHCQIWLWRPWRDAESLYNACIVFVMS